MNLEEYDSRKIFDDIIMIKRLSNFFLCRIEQYGYLKTYKYQEITNIMQKYLLETVTNKKNQKFNNQSPK